MVGRAGTKGSSWDGITPAECKPRPEILRLNDKLSWEEAREPLHKGISNNCPDAIDTRPAGIGPGMPFSNSVLRRDPAFGEIGLVPCAVGGTRLSQWSRGTCLYNRLLTRVGAAVRDGGVLRGMLWYQGESDADSDDPEVFGTYGQRVEQFFTDLRTDLKSPSLPIIQVGLASGGANNVTKREIVRNAQLNTSLPNVRCVDAAGLPLRDPLHLDTPSQIRLGSMLAV